MSGQKTVSHSSIGSSHEFTKHELLELREMFGRPAWKHVEKIIESIKKDIIESVLCCFGTEERLMRQVQGSVEMLGTLKDLPKFNDSALEEISQLEENEN